MPSRNRKARPFRHPLRSRKNSKINFRPAFLRVIFFSFFILWFGIATAEAPIQLFDAQADKNGLPLGWQPLTFKKIERHTNYRLSEEAGRPIILAESERAASGLIRPLDLDPQVYQTLSWCWKVDAIIKKGDVRTKAGDDYAARIYVTFKFDPEHASFFEAAKFKTYKLFYGEYPPKGALNYVWANRMQIGEVVPNAYTDRAMMIAVESGEEKVGQWHCAKRNLFNDYKAAFGEDPPNISGIAIMTDTDNTEASAKAAYADLLLHSHKTP